MTLVLLPELSSLDQSIVSRVDDFSVIGHAAAIIDSTNATSTQYDSNSIGCSVIVIQCSVGIRVRIRCNICVINK
jgi:hypothetical protein